MQAKLFCETAEMNGFTTRRLFEPKTQYFNDKVQAESVVVFGGKKPVWIGINAKGGPWVYTSSGTEMEFQNWYPGQPSGNAAYECVLAYITNGQWHNSACHTTRYFVCEFF